MSQQEINQLNKVCRTVIVGIAAVLAVFAFIFNPCHLFTAGVIFAAGLEVEVVKADKFDLR